MTPPVAYPGPAGTHTEAAAVALFPEGPHVPVTGFRAVAEAVASAEAAYGVLPIESSLAGAVAETHDLLYERALSIVGETILPIRHQLAVAADVPLEAIRVVRSHPQALEQCRGLLARLPQAQVVPVATTAEAARSVAEDGDPTSAAIAGEEAVRLYGLRVLVDDAADGVAFTRFVSIAPFTRVAGGLRDARTAFTFVTDHRPGALFAAIEPFARAGLDLVRLVSRPLPATPWRYRFDAVVAGHPLEPAVRVALRELSDQAAALRVVGVYEGHSEVGA
jgi:chorismate mutase / prephenate dehydratase